ncbi:MAG: hypothetical protein KAJ75_01005 [Alphaproteobacteria bacterium]|nr:hypothetical protein [Alphaproteobacteria bacterium]
MNKTTSKNRKTVRGKKTSSNICLLPAVIFVAVLLLTVKLGSVWEAGTQANTLSTHHFDFSKSISISQKQAVAQPVANKVSATMDAPGGDFSSADLDYGIPNPREFGIAPSFSQSELDILQKLAERREALDAHERGLEQRVAMLEAAETQIDQKVMKLKQLQSSIKELLETYNEQEQKKMTDLVKIYSNMKPKDAARIFNELEMPILISVFKRMNARKSSAILAKMNSKRAKELTTEIAEGNKFPIDGISENNFLQ